MELHPDQLERRRARLARRARVVGWAKILLPLGALVLIAAIFWAGRETGDVTDLFTPEELARLGAGMKLDNPRLAGVTERDQPYELTARSAVPDGPMAEEITLDAPSGWIETDDRVVRAAAATGLVDRGEKRLALSGDVSIETSDGWRGETDLLTVDLEARTARSTGPVTATGPQGSLQAGSFRAEQPEGAEPTIWFEDRVRLVFIPAKEG